MADDVPLVMSNPAVQPPRKQPPSRLSLHSRSLSRSSSRQYTHARDFDPILRNLSPTTTLRAFSEPGLLATNDILHTSLQNATYSQRTLGAKAAQTGLDVRSWARELEEWDWPGSFDLQESTRKISEDIDIAEENGSAPPYCGSLPAATVKEYEQRADEIVHQLDDIDVEELKDFVLSAHHEAGNGSASMDDSIGAIGAATDLRKLDDFTAIITATIMQALPYLSRLNRLLDTWTLRLAILRQAPYFLEGLEQAHADLEGAWRAIGVASATDADKEKSINFNRGHMIETQSIIEHKVSGLGRKLDRFLDDLEGRSETVPDTWIEKMETLEQQYAEWTVRAERKVLENELKKNRWSKIASPKSPQSPRRIQPNPVNKEETSARSEASAGRSLVDPPVSLPANNTIPNRTLAADTASPAGQVSSHALSTDREASSILELARDDSQTIPSDQADVIVDKGSVHSRTSSRRSRHVAIILPYDGGDGQEYPSEGITGDLVSRGGSSASQKQPGPVPAASSSDGAVSFAKKRAMFTGDLERTQSLQRATKSPVRPFEHASNAFARLFNKMETSTPERSRSSSRTEVERLRSASNKTENGIIWGGRPSSSAKQSPRRKTMDSGPRNIPKGQDKAIDNAPVAVEADAPPVPTLPPKSPRRSLQSPMKPAERNSATSTASPKQSKTLPFPDFDFGENWPLTPPEPASEHDSPVEAQIARFQAQTTDECEGPSLISPKKPLESDFFHRVFVEGMPNTLEHDRVPSPALPEDHHLAPAFDYAEPPQEQSSHSQSAVPTIHPSMLNSTPESVQQAHFVSREASITTPPMIQKPNHIDLPTNSSLPVPLQSADGPVTPNSVASDTYSPEIQDARVSYFQMTSPSLSRTTSAATTSPNHQRVLSSQTTSPTKMRNSSNGEGTNNDHEAMYDNLTRRASGMSLEVKTIDLTRRKSNSSAIESNVHTLVDEPSSPISRNEMSIFPTPPTIHEERPRSPVSPLVHSPGQHELRHRTSNLSVVSDHTSPAPEQAGLNAFMGKRRGMGLQSGNAPVNGRTKKKPEPDSFDRHVSEVIQRLPSAIRFRSGATTPQPGDSRSFSGPRPKLNPRVSSRMSENITLAPADPSPNRRSPAANEPEVKLYHLTQAGREEPIKLFVRLVGEGERVMVRVGGGWADLADYLRQYAEHHGSRTVSGEVDVKAFSSPITAGGNGGIHPALRRKASGPLSNELYRTKSNTPSPDTPVHDIAEHPEKENSDSSGLLSTSTPTRPPVVPPRSPSRPSTSDSNRPGSKHSWAGSSISGTGGSGKKFDDLSEDKKRWVEGMIDRVQTAGADKKGEAQQKQKFFGEMGTVGGTRRVVFNRSASGADMGRN